MEETVRMGRPADPGRGEGGLEMPAGQAAPAGEACESGRVRSQGATLGAGVRRDCSGPVGAGTREGPASQLPGRF